MFIGRKKELDVLEKRYKQDEFECVIIYGRRRVGKTTLINEFTKNKKTIFFTGLDTNSSQNLEQFSKSILEIKGISANTVFATWEDAFEEVYHMAKEERIVLVIDEYPYLANGYPVISSILSKWIDQKFLGTKLYMILCGSSLSFMEEQVLGYQSPLYGRRTAQMKIQPFSFEECKEYYHNFSKTDLAVAYGITGGIPLYMSKLDDGCTIGENIINNFFDSSSYLFEEPEKLLQQECREPRQYNAIISAIANGASKLSEITTKAGLKDTATTSAYMKKMLSLGLIEKEIPYGAKGTKKAIYKISDGMFQFWYRFVPANYSLIQQGAGELVYTKNKQQIDAYMGFVFENICKEYLWKENLAGKLPIQFTDIGRWWGTNPKTRNQEEIDLIADDGEGNAIFAECKWRNENVDKDEICSLIEQSSLFNYKQCYFVLFSKTDFTKQCYKLAEEMGNILLIKYENM